MLNAPDTNTPLRLADAVQLAFPFGGMTVSGIRREAARGRLVIERIAGKDFVTLAAIEAMRELCRVQPEQPVTTERATASELGKRNIATEAFLATIRKRQAEDKAAKAAERAAEKAKYATERLARERTK